MDALRDIEFTQIAADWDSAPLGREKEPLLLLMRNGLTVEQSKERGELRVTRTETISDGFIDEKKVRSVSGLSPEQVEKYRIHKGDILFSHINSDPHLGKTAIASRDYADLLHGMNLLLLRANKKVLEPQFLHFVCCYYRMKGVFVKICSRSVNQSSINQAKLKALVIPLPPLPEQHKIAGVLGVLQRTIEQQERLLQLTAELKKTLLHQLFTQGLRGEPQKQTKIGLMPQSWEPTPLGTCCDIVSGSLSYTDFLKMALVDDSDTTECMGVKVSDMNLPGNENKFVTANAVRHILLATAHRKLIPPNTVVFPKRGAAIATNKKRLTTTWTVLDPNLIGVHAKDSLDADFLFHWLQTFDLRRITDPGPTPQLNKKDLIPICLPLPKEIDERTAPQ
ncbi:MAG: restriction endonuclease subunit S [Sulfuricaulis sp.]|nr:restriction endonuclease subunit S [Sulfuricaulis sp.]